MKNNFKRILCVALTVVLFLGVIPFNSTIAGSIENGFAIIASALEHDKNTTWNFRYDEEFNEKTLSTYIDFTSYYDSEYSFAIPGLENTNVLGVACDTMVPQAFCFAGDYMLITAYDGKEKYEKEGSLCVERDKCNSVIYVLSNTSPENRKYLTTLVLPCDSHAGGIAFDGENIWVSNENQKISALKYSVVQSAVNSGVDSVAVEFVKTIEIDTKPSFMTYYNGNLWVGTHEKDKRGAFYGYDISALKDALTIQAGICVNPKLYSGVPSRTQGVVFTEVAGDTYLIVSRSLGRNEGKENYISQIEFYKPDFSSPYIKLGKNLKTLTTPPMIEGIAVAGAYLYCCFESASTLYSTIEDNLCETPTDRICALDLTSLFSFLEDYENNDEIKYTDLFFGYPYYLDNDIETQYANLIIEQYTDVLSRYSDNGTLDFLARLRTGNSEGLSIYIKAIGSSLGLTDSYYEECADKAAMELLQTIYSDRTAMMEFSGSIAKGLKNIKSFGDVGTATTEAIAYCMEYLTSDEVEEICETIKKGCEEYYKVEKVNVSDDGKLYYFTIDYEAGVSGTNDFFNLLETGVDFMEIITTICFIEDIKMGVLQKLIDSLDEKSELRATLIKYNDEVLGSFKNYISGCYLADKAINKIAKFLMDKVIWDNLNFGAVSKLLGGFIIDAAFYVVYDKAFDIGSGEDIIVTTMLSTFVTELDIAIMSQKLKFFKVFYASDVLDYEVLYNAYISAIKTTLVYSKKIADDTQKENLEIAYNNVCSNYTWENYIRLCKKSVNSTPANERIKKTADLSLGYSITTEGFSIAEPSDDLNFEDDIYLVDGELFYGLNIKNVGFSFSQNLKVPNIKLNTDNYHSVTVVVEENVNIDIMGDFLVYAYDDGSKLTFNSYGNVSVGGDFSVYGTDVFFGTSAHAYANIYGSMFVIGNSSVESNAYLTVAETAFFKTEGKYLQQELFALAPLSQTPTLSLYGTMVVGEFVVETSGCVINTTDKSKLIVNELFDCYETFSNGIIYIYGDIYNEMNASGTNTVVLCGSKKQIINDQFAKFANLVVQNTSEEGVVLNANITVNGEYHSPIKQINTGEFKVIIGSQTTLFTGNHYGDINLNSDYTFKQDVVLNGNVNILNEYDITIPKDISVVVNGNMLLKAYSNSIYPVSCYVIINGDLTVKGKYLASDKIAYTKMTNQESHLSVFGDSYINPYSGSDINNGTINLYGNIKYVKGTGANKVVICGEEKQIVKSANVSNLVVQNTSEEGVVLNANVTVNGDYYSPIKPINQGDYYVKIGSDATLFSGNHYGDIYIGANYTFKRDVVLNDNLYILGKYTVTIPKKMNVTVKGDILSAPSSTYNYYVTINGALTVEGKYVSSGKVAYTKMTQTDSSLTVYGNSYVRASSNDINEGVINLYGNVYYMSGAGNNKVVLCGSEKQTIKNGTFATLIHDNTSDEGVEFTSAVKVNTLFNHKGRPFTLYDNGEGSTFVDYDGDGLKDNVDPEPTVGNPCTITVKTENAEKGTVCESFDTIGGTVITVTAEPTFKYDFSSWKNSSGKVLSNNSSYSFVAKGDTTVTAYFTKRKRNITVKTENGTLTVPSKAAIESTVTVTPKPSAGYLFTENSITVNGELIEGTTFVMPDEDVVLGAEFYANIYYFALKEELTSAKAIDQKLYSAETTAILKTAITNAQNSLVNEITQQESDARIAELQVAIAQLKPRYVVSVTTTQTTTLTVLQNATSPLNKVTVYANYDNGTKVKITDYEVSGLDVSVLGEQTATLTYEGYSTTVNARVTTQSILDVETLISKIPETVTVTHINQVNTAKAQYDALSDEEKNQVQGVEKLLSAMEIVDAICKDIDTAAEFDAKVLSIANLDGDKIPYIEEAFEEYNSFTDSVKSFVTQYELLEHLSATNEFVATEISSIDYVNKFIICDEEMVTDINALITNYEAVYDQVEINSSLSNSETNFFGTGSTIDFYKDGELQFTYTVVVQGDVNGDSVCDVLDCMLMELVRNNHTTLENEYLQAGDLTGDGTIDVSDFQAVVGVAIGEGTFIGYESEPELYTQEWFVSERKPTGQPNEYMVRIYLRTNYNVGPLQFEVEVDGFIQSLNMEDEKVYYGYTFSGAPASNPSNDAYSYTPHLICSTKSQPINGKIMDIYYTSESGAQLSIVNNPRTEDNPEGTLFAGRATAYTLNRSNYILGQKTIVHEPGILPEDITS